MSPQRQAAQIANAQKSHGPVTEAGRARSSQNSIRHSLCSKKYFIVPEERPEFDIYYNDLIAALAPEGAIESLLAEKIILDEWRLTRARLHENQIFFRAYMSSEQQVAAGAETWLAHSKELATLTLYEQRINRVLAHNKVEFSSMQSMRRDACLPVSALLTTQNPVEPSPSVSQHIEAVTPVQPAGFVHSSDASAPASDPQPPTPAATRLPGFVHSSDASAPISDPQPLTAASNRPVGFVRSSTAIAAHEPPATHTEQPLATVESVPSPPAVSRRAA